MLPAMAARHLYVPLLVIGVSALTGACGGSDDDDDETPVDVSGAYSVAVTNRANGCEFMNWTEGDMSTNIPLTIEQNGSDVTGTIDGAPALVLAFVTGNNEFTGTVSGTDFTMTSYGTINHVEGNCSFTWNVTISGSLSGNALAGTVTYAPATNDNPDCSAIQCTSLQEFSGSRPPP